MTAVEHISLEGLKGWGGWSLFFLAVIWWIRGIPERKRSATEGEAALRLSYGDYIDRLSKRIDTMEAEHSSDRSAWMLERTAIRTEHEADRIRWGNEREQWRKERTELMDQVAGLERKLRSYGSSVTHIENDGLNAPTVSRRLTMGDNI